MRAGSPIYSNLETPLAGATSAGRSGLDGSSAVVLTLSLGRLNSALETTGGRSLASLREAFTAMSGFFAVGLAVLAA